MHYAALKGLRNLCPLNQEHWGKEPPEPYIIEHLSLWYLVQRAYRLRCVGETDITMISSLFHSYILKFKMHPLVNIVFCVIGTLT